MGGEMNRAETLLGRIAERWSAVRFDDLPAEAAEVGRPGRPADDFGLQWERLSSKFRGLAAPVVGAEEAERLRRAVADLAPARALALLAQGRR